MCSAAEAVNYRAAGRAPGWAPGWTLRGDLARGVARGRVNDHGDESTFVSRSLAHDESRHDAVSPVSPEKTPGFPGWASPGGSHHFFGTLPPARSQLVTEIAAGGGQAAEPLSLARRRRRWTAVQGQGGRGPAGQSGRAGHGGGAGL